MQFEGLLENYERRIFLPGSEAYWDSYDRGYKLQEMFPGQDVDDFASACGSNSWGPAEKQGIASIMCIQSGMNDSEEWIWLVRLLDGTHWWVVGGCDYTGWDCQSYLDWARYEV